MKKEVEELRSQMDDFIKEHGFGVHCVECETYHTHGIFETLGHLDIEINLPLPYKTAMGILHDMYNRIKDGETFEDGDMLTDLIKNYPVKLVERIETGRQVIRILFPDPNGKFPGEKGCMRLYNSQELSRVK